MDASIAQEALKILGINSDEKRLRLLAAILRAQSKFGQSVGFKDLKSQLEGDERGNTVADSLLYRLLSQLENDEFIKIDRTNYRHIYSSGITNIQAGLEKALQETLIAIDAEIEEIDSEIDSLNNLDISDFARSTLKVISGRKHKIKSESALGLEGLKSLLSKRIYSDISKHDLLRIAIKTFDIDDQVQALVLRHLEKYSQTKFQIRLLITHSLSEDQEKNAINQLEKLKSNGCDAYFHACEQPSILQSFISRNSDGILLTPSDYPHVSVWIPRILNSSLVDETITTFDEEFSTNFDILGGVKD